MVESGSKKKPTVVPTKDGPYLVKGFSSLRDSRGRLIPAKSSMMLCRCGGSRDKPFCDGMHVGIGFSGDKVEGRVPEGKSST